MPNHIDPRLWIQEAGVLGTPGRAPGLVYKNESHVQGKVRVQRDRKREGISLHEQGFGLSVHCQSFSFLQPNQSNGSPSRNLACLTKIIIIIKS